MLIITYNGEHNHPMPTQRNTSAGSSRSKTITSCDDANGKNSPTKEKLEENDTGVVIDEDILDGLDDLVGPATKDIFFDHHVTGGHWHTTNFLLLKIWTQNLLMIKRVLSLSLGHQPRTYKHWHLNILDFLISNCWRHLMILYVFIRADFCYLDLPEQKFINPELICISELYSILSIGMWVYIYFWEIP